MNNLLPGVYIDLQLERRTVATNKIDSALLLMAFPKVTDPENPDTPELMIDGKLEEPNFLVIQPGDRLSKHLNMDFVGKYAEIAYDPDGPLQTRYEDTYTTFNGHEVTALTGPQKTDRGKELSTALIAAYIELLIYQIDLPIKLLRENAPDIQITVAYSYYEDGTKGLSTPVPGRIIGDTSPNNRAGVYKNILTEIDLNQDLPLSVVIFPQERFFNDENLSPENAPNRYESALPVLNNVGWGLMSFVNGPFPRVDNFFNPAMVSAGKQLDRAMAYADHISDYLASQSKPPQGFASMWHGFSYIGPPSNVAIAEYRLYLLQQGIDFSDRQALDVSPVKYESSMFDGNYVPLSWMATAWFIRLNQNDIGYYAPSAQSITLPSLADFSRVRATRADAILKTGHFNYGWQVSDLYTLVGAKTLDKERGWQWINSRLAMSVLRDRLIRAAGIVQFSPSDPEGQSVSLELRALAAQVCQTMLAEGGLIRGVEETEAFRLIGPDVSIEDGTLTMAVRARVVGTAAFINIDVINTDRP